MAQTHQLTLSSLLNGLRGPVSSFSSSSSSSPGRWGQVFILDCLAKYTGRDAREAEGIVERITPRLQHANAAVVLSAVKVRPAGSAMHPRVPH